MLSFSHQAAARAREMKASLNSKQVNMCERRRHLTENGTKGVKFQKAGDRHWPLQSSTGRGQSAAKNTRSLNGHTSHRL